MRIAHYRSLVREDSYSLAFEQWKIYFYSFGSRDDVGLQMAYCRLLLPKTTSICYQQNEKNNLQKFHERIFNEQPPEPRFDTINLVVLINFPR
jgi:hypothetical protein